jgi:hypothetical protein
MKQRYFHNPASLLLGAFFTVMYVTPLEAHFTKFQQAIRDRAGIETLTALIPVVPQSEEPLERRTFTNELLGATILAIRHSRLDVIELILRHFNTNPFFLRDDDGRTVVHQAALRNSLGAIKTMFIFAQRLRIDLPLLQQDLRGNTPAMEARSAGHRVAESLLQTPHGLQTIFEEDEEVPQNADDVASESVGAGISAQNNNHTSQIYFTGSSSTCDSICGSI